MVLRKPLLIKFTIKICLIIHINIYKILFFFFPWIYLNGNLHGY